MSDTYTTISGDMWDYIAFKTMGSEKYMDLLIKNNIKYRNTVIFPGGINLSIPEITVPKSSILPPWRK